MKKDVEKRLRYFDLWNIKFILNIEKNEKKRVCVFLLFFFFYNIMLMYV